DVLVCGDDDLWHVVVRPGGLRQVLGVGLRRESPHTIEQRTDVGRDAILFHDLRQVQIQGRGTRFHAPILFETRAGVSRARARVTTEPSQAKDVTILLTTEGDDRAAALRAQLAMVFPRAAIAAADAQLLAEARLPEADVALLDTGAVVRGVTDSLRLLRARGFVGPIVVVTPVPDDAGLCITI